MPYCHSPWTNLDIDPQGYMSPCCKFDYSQYKESQHNIIKHTIDEYINLPNSSSKGNGGRIIPLHKDIKENLKLMLTY